MFVSARGCGFSVIEGTVYDALKQQDDNSIDLFYWNDVIEHLCPDEIEGTLKLLYEKMAVGGTVLTITPNALIDPHDITAFVSPKEKTAQGLHLKEYTYTEIRSAFRAAGFKTKGHFEKKDDKDIYSKKLCGARDMRNMALEKLMAATGHIDGRIVCRYELNVSVMGKA